MTDEIDWAGRWRDRRLGFHKSGVHDDLLTHQERFLGDGNHRVLVPLCGKSVDMVWLAKQGNSVVGVEWVEAGVREFFAEHEISPEITSHGPFTSFTAGAITILCGDVLTLNDAPIEPFDRIWDRAALVALPPDTRQSYVATLRAAAAPGTLVLQNSFTYEQSRMSGPPFSVSAEDIGRLYDGCEIELLQERDDLATIPFTDYGHEYWLTSTYLIRL